MNFKDYGISFKLENSEYKIGIMEYQLNIPPNKKIDEENMKDIFTINSYNETKKIGEIAVEVSNIDFEKVVNDIDYLISKQSSGKVIYEELKKNFSDVVSALLTNEMINRKEKSPRDKLMTLKIISTSLLNKDIDNSVLINTVIDLQKMNVKTTYNGVEIISLYETETIYSILTFDISMIKNNAIQVNVCQNCGKFFIPRTRSDEIYCNNIFKNNKTCSQIGYEIKANKDEFISSYRTTYKTMKAREGRVEGKLKIKYIECTNEWVKDAKDAMEECKAKDDIGAFKSWLTESLSLYKPY
jgi:hypothetical protein